MNVLNLDKHDTCLYNCIPGVLVCIHLSRKPDFLARSPPLRLRFDAISQSNG